MTHLVLIVGPLEPGRTWIMQSLHSGKPVKPNLPKTTSVMSKRFNKGTTQCLANFRTCPGDDLLFKKSYIESCHTVIVCVDPSRPNACALLEDDVIFAREQNKGVTILVAVINRGNAAQAALVALSDITSKSGALGLTANDCFYFGYPDQPPDNTEIKRMDERVEALALAQESLDAHKRLSARPNKANLPKKTESNISIPWLMLNIIPILAFICWVIDKQQRKDQAASFTEHWQAPILCGG